MKKMPFNLWLIKMWKILLFFLANNFYRETTLKMKKNWNICYGSLIQSFKIKQSIYEYRCESDTIYYKQQLDDNPFKPVLRIHSILMWIRILDPHWKKMDPDPQHCFKSCFTFISFKS